MQIQNGSVSDPPSQLKNLIPEQQGAPFQITKTLQQPFTVNSALQHLGFSSSTSYRSLKEGHQFSTTQVAGNAGVGGASLNTKADFKAKQTSSSPHGIEDIIVGYVHHEVTRKLVLMYLRPSAIASIHFHTNLNFRRDVPPGGGGGFGTGRQ